MSLPPSAVKTVLEIVYALPNHDSDPEWQEELNRKWVPCSAVADELERIAKLNSRTDMKLDLEIVIRTLRRQKEGQQ